MTGYSPFWCLEQIIQITIITSRYQKASCAILKLLKSIRNAFDAVSAQDYYTRRLQFYERERGETYELGEIYL